MALTITKDSGNYGAVFTPQVYAKGDMKFLTGKVDFDSSYPTGGEAMDISKFFKNLLGVTFETKSGYVFEYDYTNKKVKALERHSVYSAAVDPPSIAAGAIADVAVTVTDITTSDRIIAIPPADLEEDLLLQLARASAADTITLRLQNTKVLGNTRMYSAAIDPASIAADSTADTAVAVTGVTTVDRIVAFSPIDLENGLVLKSVWASAANQITVRIQNTTAAAVDGVSKTWNFLAMPEPAAIDGASKTWTFIAYRDQAREVKNATDLSAVTGVRFFAWGY